MVLSNPCQIPLAPALIPVCPGLVARLPPAASHLTQSQTRSGPQFSMLHGSTTTYVLDLPSRPSPRTTAHPGHAQAHTSTKLPVRLGAHARVLTHDDPPHTPSSTDPPCRQSEAKAVDDTGKSARPCVSATPHRGSTAGCMRVVNSSSEHAIGR